MVGGMIGFGASTWKGILMAGLMVTLGLAGCSGDSGSGLEAGVAGTDGAHDAKTGSITGRVLDDSLLPVVARVALLTPDGKAVYEVVDTDESGKYAFNFIPAGKYQVEARASGYEPAMRSVDVSSGQVLQGISFTMEAGFADVAYFVIDSLTRVVGGGTVKYGFHCAQTPWAPYSPPSLASLIGKHCVGGNICPDDIHAECGNAAASCQGSYSKETDADDNGYGGSSYNGGYRDLLMGEDKWKTQLAEVTWQPSSSVSGQGVLFEILGPNVTNADGSHTNRCGGINQSDPRDFLIVSDEPPFRLEINDALLAARGVTEEDRCCDWRWRLFPGWCDLGNCARWGPDANALGVLAPTRVDIYYTVFFKEEAPPGWSTLPDQ